MEQLKFLTEKKISLQNKIMFLFGAGLVIGLFIGAPMMEKMGFRTGFWNLFGKIILTAAVLAIIRPFILSYVLKPLNKFSELMGKLANQDLTGKLDIHTGDEIEVLADRTNQMMENLRNILKDNLRAAEELMSSASSMSTSATQVNTATKELAATIDDIAEGTEKQAQNAQQTTDVVRQMAASAEQVASGAQMAADTSTSASERAKMGEQALNRVIDSMAQIRETVENSANVVLHLGNRSQEIEKIVDVIQGILALNATIEAARAGEHGRGFAVVAEEVRKLAEQTSQSAGQIVKLIEEIQGSTNEAMVAMKLGTQAVEEGNTVAKKAETAFQQINQAVSETVHKVQEIAAAAQQQAASSQELMSAIETVAGISNQTAAGTEEMAADVQEQTSIIEQLARSAADLVHMAEDLTALVGRFKVKENFQRCWRVNDCSEVNCPAYQSSEEKCWMIPGTYCGGEIQGTAAEKRSTCQSCKVFKLNNVLEEK
jgi:methyl-accepting chemotaxis protein